MQSEKLASTGRLAAGMIHEIGNPLASVLGLLDLRPPEMSLILTGRNAHPWVSTR